MSPSLFLSPPLVLVSLPRSLSACFSSSFLPRFPQPLYLSHNVNLSLSLSFSSSGRHHFSAARSYLTSLQSCLFHTPPTVSTHRQVSSLFPSYSCCRYSSSLFFFLQRSLFFIPYYYTLPLLFLPYPFPLRSIRESMPSFLLLLLLLRLLLPFACRKGAGFVRTTKFRLAFCFSRCAFALFGVSIARGSSGREK